MSKEQWLHDRDCFWDDIQTEAEHCRSLFDSGKPCELWNLDPEGCNATCADNCPVVTKEYI